jgi:hypothetical protein
MRVVRRTGHQGGVTSAERLGPIRRLPSRGLGRSISSVCDICCKYIRLVSTDLFKFLLRCLLDRLLGFEGLIHRRKDFKLTPKNITQIEFLINISPSHKMFSITVSSSVLLHVSTRTGHHQVGIM